MSTGVQLTLAKADEKAKAVGRVLARFSDRFKVVGSIRRRCPNVGDIDFVVEPRGGTAENREAIVAAISKHAHCERRGAKYASWTLRHGETLDVWFSHPGIVDLFNPQPSNWGMLELVRTGSREHNLRLIQIADGLGLKFDVQRGVIRDGEVIASKTERDVFEALGLCYLKPKERNV